MMLGCGLQAPPPKWDTPNFLDFWLWLAFLLVLLAFPLVFLCFLFGFPLVLLGGAPAPRTIHRGGRRRGADPAYVPQGGRGEAQSRPRVRSTGGAGGGAQSQRETKQHQRKSKQNQSKTKPNLKFQGVYRMPSSQQCESSMGSVRIRMPTETETL